MEMITDVAAGTENSCVVLFAGNVLLFMAGVGVLVSEEAVALDGGAVIVGCAVALPDGIVAFVGCV